MGPRMALLNVSPTAHAALAEVPATPASSLLGAASFGRPERFQAAPAECRMIALVTGAWTLLKSLPTAQMSFAVTGRTQLSTLSPSGSMLGLVTLVHVWPL